MGLGIRTKLRNLRERQLNRQYARELAKLKQHIPYEEWIRKQEGEKKYYWQEWSGPFLAERCTAAGQQQGVGLLREQGILLICQSRGYVDSLAFTWILEYFREHPAMQLLYGDEDVMEGAAEGRRDPLFRPDWSPDTWLSTFYLGSVIALRRELVQRLPRDMWPEEREILYFEQPDEVRLLVHRLLELAGGFERGDDAIAHLPKILFHMTQEGADAGPREGYSRENRLEWQETEQGRQALTVSVIIPSKDNPETLKQCLDSLRQSLAAAEDTWPGGLEILVVDNGSSPENKEEIEKITYGMKYIYEPAPFNFSKMCNRGAQEATGQVFLFLNDDITVCPGGWLQAMTDHALRPYAGAVGLKLYYPDSVKIQHAGIANLPGGPVHKLQFTLDGQEQDHGYGSLDRNVIAVTGACLMVERERFWQVGGFPEDLPVAYNDVELCFCLREAGYHNMVVNTFHAYHHESLSRGSDMTQEKMLRLRRERQTLYDRHPRYRETDPYYPEPLCRELGDTHIYENYLHIVWAPQALSGFRRQRDWPEQEPENMSYKVTISRNGRMGDKICVQGWAVVHQDNNACYERVLLLRGVEGTSGVYATPFYAQYSSQAEYGMQEQPNVALCGFKAYLILTENLRDGDYRIGIQIRSRVGRRRLTVWTACSLRVKDEDFEIEGPETECRIECRTECRTERNA